MKNCVIDRVQEMLEIVCMSRRENDDGKEKMKAVGREGGRRVGCSWFTVGKEWRTKKARLAWSNFSLFAAFLRWCFASGIVVQVGSISAYIVRSLGGEGVTTPKCSLKHLQVRWLELCLIWKTYRARMLRLIHRFFPPSTYCLREHIPKIKKRLSASCSKFRNLWKDVILTPRRAS